VREIELYAQAGFTPEEALAAATIEAARNVGVDGRTGSIATGKAADLVLVEGDPPRRQYAPTSQGFPGNAHIRRPNVSRLPPRDALGRSREGRRVELVVPV